VLFGTQNNQFNRHLIMHLFSQKAIKTS